MGGALLVLGRLAGVEVLGTAAASSKQEELAALGAVPFDYRSKDWIAKVRESGNVDAVFDPLGYESFDESYAVLRRGGVLVGYGMNLPALTGRPRGSALPVILKLLGRNLLFWRGRRTSFFGLTRTSKHFNPDLTTLFSLLQKGEISVPIKGTFRLEQIREAHRAYASGAGRGSIILAIS